MIRARHLSLLGLAALAAAPTAASAYNLSESHWNPASLPIQYQINESTAPSSIGAAAAVAALEGGEATWAGPACTSWRAVHSGSTTLTRAQAGDRQNSMLWISGSWPAELGDVNSVIGVTTPVWSSGGYFIDADIQFNNVGFTWSTTGARNTVDAQSIATHEEGHFLGLDHSASSSAVMYASYSGGIKRDLTSDDQGGVCTIYPSGVTVPDAGVTVRDAGTVVSTDPCAARSGSCGACTPINNCGWCGATNTCATSTQAGFVNGTCSGGFVWFPEDCTTTTTPVDAGSPPTGMSAFGEPCTSPTDCASGGLCVGQTASTAFCSRNCTDDCTCPHGYACNGRLTSGATICVPGTGTCTTPIDAGGPVGPTDSGVVTRTDTGAANPTDAGTKPGRDAGTAAGDDAGTAATDDAGEPLRSVPATSGCGCRVPGPAGDARTQGAWALAALAAVLTSMRRRRR